MTLNGQTTSARTRVALWDNARFALIVLVVIGHLISTIRTDTELGFGIYAYIYLFHMPAMILLSGMFSKPEVTPKAIVSTIQLLVTWLLWEGIWAGIHGFVEHRPPGKSFLVSPAWTLWFLVTLVTMRILLPYIAKLKHPLVFSIGVALLAPVLPAIGSQFSAARTLAFLPFFVAGWLARERGWLTGDWFMRPRIPQRAAAWGVLGGVAVCIALASVVAPGQGGLRGIWRIDKWLTHRDGYAWLFSHAPIAGWSPGGSGFAGWLGMIAAGILVAAVLLAIAALMTLALLLIVPRSASVATVWGARTLYVYLLHGVLVWGLREASVVDAIGDALGWMGVLVLVVIAAAAACVLSLAWVPRVFGRIVEPRVPRLLRD